VERCVVLRVCEAFCEVNVVIGFAMVRGRIEDSNKSCSIDSMDFCNVEEVEIFVDVGGVKWR